MNNFFYEYSDKFCFDEMKFDVKTASQIDRAWIRFILRKYLVESNFQTEVDILVPSTDSNGFMKNHLNNRVANKIMVNNKGLFEEWNDMRSTPIPPFLLKPYLGCYILMHGCALCAPNGKITVICGSSMAGKTCLSLFLVKKGYKLISDDLLVFSTRRKQLISYAKPVGVRESSLYIDSKIGDCIKNQSIEKLKFTSRNGNSTWLIHIDDIYPSSLSTNSFDRINRLIFLKTVSSGIVKTPLKVLVSDLSQSIINSGVPKVNAIEFMLSFFSITEKIYTAPVHSGEYLANFVYEEDNF